jgi:raffinose/stachyose/melibiose transport system permease protein
MLIIIAPVFLSGYYSVLKWDGVSQPLWTGLSNYARLVGDPLFLKAVWHTVLFAAASVCVQLPFALLLALILASKVKGERFFVTVYFIPVILSAVVIGQLWMRIYHTNHGLLNLLLKSLGFGQAGRTVWLGDMKTALIAVMVPILWQYVGYHMLLFYSGVRSISPDIFEAAKIDGASFGRTAFSITIPLLRPILQVSITFAVTGSMKVYDLVKVLTDGGPSNASDVISTVLVRTMIYPGNNYGYGSAMAVVLIALCFILYFGIGRLFKEPDA